MKLTREEILEKIETLKQRTEEFLEIRRINEKRRQEAVKNMYVVPFLERQDKLIKELEEELKKC